MKFPPEIPPGTDPLSLFSELLPADHARYVPAAVPGESGKPPIVVVVHIADKTALGLALTFEILGAMVRVSQGDSESPQLRVFVRDEDVRTFLRDWAGDRKWVPKFPVQGDVSALTDPRLMRRLIMATGRLELALKDFEGRRATLGVSSGPRAKKAQPEDDADVVVETSVATFERVLAGHMGPEEALADKEVSIRGKKLVAMQFAFALAPFFPSNGSPKR